MTKPLRVLIVEDNEDDALLLVNLLKDGGFKPVFERVETSEDMKSALSQKEWDCIISDYSMPHFSGLSALLDYKTVGLDIPFILVSGSIGEDFAVAAMKAGAHDYIMKGKLQRLIPALERELAEVEVRRNRKQAEETLQKREAYLTAIIENQPGLMWLKDTESRFLAVNRAFAISCGRKTPADVVGKTDLDIWPCELAEKYRTDDAKVMQTNRSLMVEELVYDKGEAKWFETFKTPVRDAHGNIIGTTGYAHDITERKRVKEELLRAHDQLLEAQRLAHIGSWEADFVSGKLVWSEEMYRIYGVDRESFGHTREALLELIHPEDRHILLDSFKTILSGKQNLTSHQLRIVHPDGSIRFIESSNKAYFDSSGKPVRVIGTTQDITERKKAEEQIAMLATALKSIKEAVCITDPQNTIQFVNQAFVETYGYSENELIGRNIEIIRSPNNPPELVRDILPNAIRNRWQGELLNQRKDGSEFPVFLSTTSIRGSDGQPIALIGIASDITERKLVEKALRKSEEQFRLISENVADMIAVLDLDGKRIYNNPAYKPLVGDPKLLQGTDSFQEIHPEDREKIKKIFKETVKTGIGQTTEYRFVAKDGSIHVIESHGSAIRDKEGKITNVVVVSRDITETKALEQQLLRSQRMESIGTLAGGIAHDLNNVLAPIMLSFEILSKKLPDEQDQKMFQMLESTAKRGSDLIKQVLSFARGMEGERTIVQVRHLIDEIGKITKETFPKSISVQIDVPKNLPTISADATQIHQVLMNLCVNARDAMPDGGTIKIKAESMMLDKQYTRMHLDAKTGLHVIISVTDQGMGIPPAIIERIFEPFFTTKEVGKGTGLGLSTVTTIIKSHAGFVTVYSEVGKGTTFKIYLPAQESAQVAITEEKEKLPIGNGELILVVDDEKGIREITKATLEAHGYSVMTAADGTEAIAIYAMHSQKIDLVLTDMMMPYMDGTATIRAIQKINPQTKFLVVSGLEQSRSSIKHASVTFLHKPYTSDTLLRSVNEMLHRK